MLLRHGLARTIARRALSSAAARVLCSIASLGVAGLVVAVAIDLAAGPAERSCDDQVSVLAKELIAKPGLEELRTSLAEAAFLCAKGDAEQAKAMLAGIESRWRQGGGR